MRGRSAGSSRRSGPASRGWSPTTSRARPGQLYLVYLPRGGSADLDLSEASAEFSVSWFDPRSGGPLKPGSVGTLKGGRTASLGAPPAAVDEDWLVIVCRAS
jgi:hypothetical protein